MEVGIPQTLSGLEKSFNSTGRLSTIDGMPSSVLDVKLASQSKQLVELDLYNDKDDEGEIMLLAMILLQLHGVKLPTTEEDNDLLNKKKRQRTSPDQLAILEQIFQTDKMPNQQTRVQLADQLGMSSRRVQIWFQNKRAKVKRSTSKPDGECESPDSLRNSSSSIESPSSPSSPSPDASPVLSPSAPAVATTQLQSLQLDDILESITQSGSILSTLSPSTSTSTSTDNSTSPVKQLQFSSPFTDNKPLLAASC